MRSESYKAWIDAMPIDDVRQKIERLERKLADLHVLERLYEDRNGGSETVPEPESSGDDAAEAGSSDGAGEESAEAGSSDGAGEESAEAGSSEGGSEEAAEAGSSEGGGGWTQGEGSAEHG